MQREDMSRIELTDNFMSMVMKMSDGNPGAVSALMKKYEKQNEIDPQEVMGGIGVILILDTWERYGTDIYVLFSDKCDRDARKMLMIMRATQLGLFSHVKLKQMAADQKREINLTGDEWADLDDKVCDELDGFKKAA